MNTVLLLLLVVVLGTTELPERFAQQAANLLKPLATAYLNAVRKEARDPDRLADQMARDDGAKAVQYLASAAGGRRGLPLRVETFNLLL